MKIAHIAFPLERVGGIRTYIDEFNIGARELGYKVDEFYITTNKKKKPEPYQNNFNIKNVLGFERLSWLYELKETLDDYDLILAQVPCPHLLKSYNSPKWKIVYENIDSSKVIAIIHDAYLNKYYPWFKPIAEKYKIKLLAPQTKSYLSISNVRAMKKLIPLPYKRKNTKQQLKSIIEAKIDLITDPNNFKAVKHKDLIFKFNRLFKGYKIYEFGELKTLEAKKFIELSKSYNLDIELKGWCPRDEVLSALKLAKFGLNLSKVSGYSMNMDYVIMEFADFGVMPITYAEMDEVFNFKTIQLGDPLNYDLDYISYNFDNLKRFEPKLIVKQIIEYLDESYKEPKRWW